MSFRRRWLLLPPIFSTLFACESEHTESASAPLVNVPGAIGEPMSGLEGEDSQPLRLEIAPTDLEVIAGREVTTSLSVISRGACAEASLDIRGIESPEGVRVHPFVLASSTSVATLTVSTSVAQQPGIVTVDVVVSCAAESRRQRLTVTVRAEPGSWDASFGADGFSRSLLGEANALAIRGDGKLLIAGSLAGTATRRQMAVARYRPDGTTDPDFGTAGVYAENFGVTNGLARSVVALADGRILLGGSIDGMLALLLITEDGRVDLSSEFGQGGLVVTRKGGVSEARALFVQPDGYILVAALASAGTDPRYGTPLRDFAVLRFDPKGVLDETFGSLGVATADFGSAENPTWDEAESLSVGADGSIFGVGTTQIAGNGNDMALAKWDRAGVLDGTFGLGGRVTLDRNRLDDRGNASVFQADGKVVVGGTVAGQAAVVRFDPAGTLDTTFGAGGVASTGYLGSFGEAVALATDGTITLGSTRLASSGSSDFLVSVFTAAGLKDLSFLRRGELTLNLGDGDDHLSGLAFRPDGRMVVSGTSSKMWAFGQVWR